MFYSYIEKKWEQRKVKIGLPPSGHGDKVTLEANGFAGIAVGFLSASEKRRLADLAKLDSMSFVYSDALAISLGYAFGMMKGQFYVDGKGDLLNQRRILFVANGQKPFAEWMKRLNIGSKPPRGRCKKVYADLKRKMLIE